MAVALGVWAEKGTAAKSITATRIRDGVRQQVIGSLLAIAYDRIKAIIPLKPKCGLNGAPSFCCAERSQG